MGPGDGIQIQRLMDLPTTLETAEHGSPGERDSRSHSQVGIGSLPAHTSISQTTSAASLVSQQPAGVQRVKSLLQTTGKLPSRLPPGHTGVLPPQRSISHNEVNIRQMVLTLVQNADLYPGHKHCDVSKDTNDLLCTLKNSLLPYT